MDPARIRKNRKRLLVFRNPTRSSQDATRVQAAHPQSFASTTPPFKNAVWYLSTAPPPRYAYQLFLAPFCLEVSTMVVVVVAVVAAAGIVVVG